MTDSNLDRKNLTGRRSFLAALAGLPLVPLGLTGCGGKAAGSGPSTAAEPQAFPVTITHAFGDTAIAKEPIRIATLGLGSNDACLALGVVPTAMPLSQAKPNGSTPWFDLALLDFGVAVPLLLDEAKGLPVDDLAGMGPDLILACNSALTREDYDTLSKIAPVVAYPKAPMATDWRTVLAMVGKALGRTAKAEEVRKATEASISDQLPNYPDLKNSSFVVANVHSALGSSFEVFGAESNPVRILGEFGIVPAKSMGVIQTAGRAVHPGASGPEIYEWPANRASELSADIAIFVVEHNERAGVLGSGVLNQVPAHKAKNSVLADLSDNGLALNAASPLSVKWLARNMLPQLAHAAYGAKRTS